MVDGSSDSSLFSSTDGMCVTHCIWFDKVAGIGSRLVGSWPCYLSSMMNLAAAVCVRPILTVRQFFWLSVGWIG